MFVAGAVAALRHMSVAVLGAAAGQGEEHVVEGRLAHRESSPGLARDGTGARTHEGRWLVPAPSPRRLLQGLPPMRSTRTSGVMP